MGRPRKIVSTDVEDEDAAKKQRREEDEDQHESEENESEEDESEDDEPNPYKFVSTPDGVSKYFIREYKEEMSGQDIPYKWVVESRNGRFFEANEEFEFWKKSTLACPTYGLCKMCFGSGPVGMHCQICKMNDNYYKVVLKKRDRKILDAEWISRYFGTTHLVAKADRTHNWSQAPMELIGYDAIMEFIDKRWEHRFEKNDAYLRGTMHLFDDGSSTDTEGQWTRPRAGGVTILNVVQDELFNGSTEEC